MKMFFKNDYLQQTGSFKVIARASFQIDYLNTFEKQFHFSHDLKLKGIFINKPLNHNKSSRKLLTI